MWRGGPPLSIAKTLPLPSTARLLVEAAVPLVRQPFIVLGVDGTVHRAAAVAGRSTLALEAAF
jgi:hypothetical protein